MKQEEGFNKQRLVRAYMKSNYRILGPSKHSAIKPCHWQEQKLLTGRNNRNCYKGYFGIQSHLCIQNTPSLPFCNHACVFCWRDIENASFGPKWRGTVDDPKILVEEMIWHSKNLIFEHITIERSLENLELMKILLHFLKLKLALEFLSFSLKKSPEQTEKELSSLASSIKTIIEQYTPSHLRQSQQQSQQEDKKLLSFTKEEKQRIVEACEHLTNLPILQQFINTIDPMDYIYDELEFTDILNSTRGKIHRAVLLLKNTGVFYNPKTNYYGIRKEHLPELFRPKGVSSLLSRYVTTKEDILRAFEEAKTPRHAAISLAGEPTLYPRIGELVEEFRKRNMSTFIVTNGTHPEVIRKLWKNNQLPTQLYVTVTAPNEELYKQISRPLEKNTWEKLMETLSMLPQLPCRTVIRITSIKHLNINLEFVPQYVNLFKQYTPHFIDIKGFTIEANALRLEKRLKSSLKLRDYTTEFEDIKKFALALQEQGGFEIIEEHEPSRDILLRGSWPKDRSIKIDYNGPL